MFVCRTLIWIHTDITYKHYHVHRADQANNWIAEIRSFVCLIGELSSSANTRRLTATFAIIDRRPESQIDTLRQPDTHRQTDTQTDTSNELAMFRNIFHYIHESLFAPIKLPFNPFIRVTTDFCESNNYRLCANRERINRQAQRGSGYKTRDNGNMRGPDNESCTTIKTQPRNNQPDTRWLAKQTALQFLWAIIN